MTKPDFKREIETIEYEMYGVVEVANINNGQVFLIANRPNRDDGFDTKEELKTCYIGKNCHGRYLVLNKGRVDREEHFCQGAFDGSRERELLMECIENINKECRDLNC